MSAIKRFAFITGFMMGLGSFVVVVGSVLLYLFTGKLPSVETSETGRPTWGLMAPRDVVALVRTQVQKETAKRVGAGPESDQPS
jgi:hypothetical protein